MELPNDLGLIGDNSPLPPQQLEILREIAYRRAMSDKIWFLENFWHVMDPHTMKWVLFKLRDYQLSDAQDFTQDMDEERARRIIGKARQVGETTLLTAAAGHDMLANANHPWLISSQTDEDAKGTLAERLKTPYLMLPEWFKARAPKLTDDNSEQMTFDNGSRVLSVPSTSKAGRGKVVFGVIMDEAAHAEKADDVFTALDPMCYGPLYVLSTGNGMGNFFHKTWVDSDRHDTEWKQTFHAWDVVPGRDEKWYEREKRKYRGREHIFYQEYPANREEMFAKTGMAVLPMDLLREEQEWIDPAFKIDLTMHWQDLENAPHMGPYDESHDELWVWEPPTVERHPEKHYALRDPNYVMFVDISEGLPHGDRSSIVVMNANTMEEAAAYRGWWGIEELAGLVDKIGRWYHMALVVPERNNQGITVINDLRRVHEYPRMYRMTTLATQKQDRTPRFGWITSGASKPKMVYDFIKAIRDGHVALHDVRFLEEAATFIRTPTGGFAASGQNFDDHVIGHLGAWQGVLEVGQYPVVWRDEGVLQPVTWADLDTWEEENERGEDQLARPIGSDGKPERRSFEYVVI
jgi:hypothetical protein